MVLRMICWSGGSVNKKCILIYYRNRIKCKLTLKLFNKILGYLVKSSEGFSVFCCLININDIWQCFIRLLSQAKWSGVTLSSIFLFVGVRSAQSLTAKANAPLMFRSRSPVNQIPIRSRSDINFFHVYNKMIYVSVKAVVR